MKSTIEDIRQKIQDHYYENEEHIRLNIVVRLLEKLGWDIWNPKEVFAELLVSPDEDKTKVDLALFANNYSPSVFIEIKYLGKISDRLSAIERQLRNYNRDNTATFSVITDGRFWRFYYSQTGGEFSQKSFKQIDLINDDIEDIELHFISFLGKEDIQSGNAGREAAKYLALNRKQQAMEDSLLPARRMIQEPPYLSLPECLVSLVKERNIPITIEEAIEYIKAAPTKKIEPLDQPSISKSELFNEDRNYAYDNTIEDLRFTKIIQGKIENRYLSSWSELLRYALKLGLDKGHSLDELKSLTSLKLKPGLVRDDGYRPVLDTKISMQDVPASRAAISLRKLAQKLKLRLYVEYEWGEQSPKAGKRGLIKENVI